MPVPPPNYRAEEQTALALQLLDRQGARQREQTRYATNDMAASTREIGGIYAKAIGAGVDNYIRASDRKYANEESQGRIDEQRRKKKLAEEEEAWLSEEVLPGVTRADQIRQMELDAKRAELDLKKAQTARAQYDMKQGGVKPETASDRKTRIETAANLFASGSTPEAIQNAKALGLSDAEIAAAQGMAGAAAQKAVKPPTEQEKLAGGFAERAYAADHIARQLEAKDSGYDPSSYKRGAKSIPLVGALAKSEQDRQFEQAQKDFIAAILRKESGGAISKQEFDEYGAIYFPQAGDSENVIKQKAAARERVIDNLYTASGGYAKKENAKLFTLPKKNAEGDLIAAPMGNVNPHAPVQPLAAGQMNQPKAPSPQDQAAINWARQNPNDPRAQQILQINGVR